MGEEGQSQVPVSREQFDAIINEFNQRTGALATELQGEKEKRARLEGMAEALKQPTQPEKRWTRAELKPKVEDGTMTQEEADQILLEQRERDLEKRMDKKYEEREKEMRQEQQIESRLAAYTSRIPELADKNSEAFKKVEKAFQELVADGSPADSKATEVAALRVAFGPPEKLPDRTSEKRDTHQETGGSAGSEDGMRPVDAANKVPKAYREHYKWMVENGYYSGWDDPKLLKEIEYMKK